MTTALPNPAATGSATDTPAQIAGWLLERVAFYLERPAHELDADVKLVEYGLDSVYALSLCGDVEDRYGLEVEPTLAWDYPTVNAIAGYLLEELGQR
jgi:acyl carrier protein